MARLAQRLPVVVVPEEMEIASMRNDVINDRGLHQCAARLVINAKWMAAQISFTRLLPFVSVAALG